MRRAFSALVRGPLSLSLQCILSIGLLTAPLLVIGLLTVLLPDLTRAIAQDTVDTPPVGSSEDATGDGEGEGDSELDLEDDGDREAPEEDAEDVAEESSEDDADQPGQSDLDEATLAKLTANSMGDLENVVDLCEAAISKGLDDGNRKYAEDLLTATLFEQANRLSRLIFDQQPVDPRWPRIRQIALGKLERALKVRDSQGNVHLLIARLQALPNGDRDVARTSVEKALPLLDEDPDQLSQAYQVRATVSEDKDQVLSDLNKALELNPRNLDAWRARGVYYLAAGEAEKALSDLEQLLERDPDDLLAHQAIAQTLRQLNKYDEAKEHLDRVLEANPDSPLAYNLRAKIEEEQGNLEAAIENLNEAIRLQPQNLGAILTRARLRAAEGQFDVARSDVDRALRLQPRLPQAILLRSLISAGQQRFGEAIGDLQQLLRGQEGQAAAELKLQMAAYYEMDRRPRRAVEVYSEVIAESEENAIAYRRRGDAYLSIGDQAKAVADYEAALKIQPEDSGTLNNLAWVLATSTEDPLRNGARAVELATKACELTEFSQAHIISTLAAAYAENGQFDKAEEWSAKAVEMDPETPQLANELESYRQEKPWRERQETQENTAEIGTPADDDAEESVESLKAFEDQELGADALSEEPSDASEQNASPRP